MKDESVGQDVKELREREMSCIGLTKKKLSSVRQLKRRIKCQKMMQHH